LEESAIVGIVFGQQDCKFVIHIPPKDKESKVAEQ
jgi:hypothetical protein